ADMWIIENQGLARILTRRSANPTLTGQNGQAFDTFYGRPLSGKKRKLAVDCIWLCTFAASGVMSVVSQVMRLPFVSQLKVKNILQTMHQFRIADRKEDLDTMTQVPPHEVGTA